MQKVAKIKEVKEIKKQNKSNNNISRCNDTTANTIQDDSTKDDTSMNIDSTSIIPYNDDFPCPVDDKYFYLRREDQVLISSYGPEIYEYCKELEDECSISPNFMSRHKFDPSVRTKMVDWMIEVLYAYSSDTPTFYLSVHILDSYIAKTSNILTNQEIHLLGICSLFIASKSEDIIPLRMTHVKGKIGHSKFSESEIKAKERNILQTIDFNIITTSTYDFIRTFIFDFNHNNKEFIRKLHMAEQIDIFENICVFLSKMMCHNDEFSCHNYSLRAIACIVAAFDVLRSNVKEWTKDAESFMRQWVSILLCKC